MKERKGVKPVEYMDVHQAAERWHVPERKVTALCREGRIPGARKSGKLWLLPERALRPLDGRTKEYAAARERGEVSFAPDAAGASAGKTSSTIAGKWIRLTSISRPSRKRPGRT